jgi:hypothetical protein
MERPGRQARAWSPWVRHACAVVVGMVSIDLLWVLLTRSSILGGAPVGGLGFGIRLATLLAAGFVVARTSATYRRYGHEASLALAILFLLGLAHFQFVGPRTVGDGTMYYVYVRSVWKDFDLDFADEYGHYGLLRPDRGDLLALTATGHRRSIFAIGPTVLWSPFFLLGEGVGRLQQWWGRPTDLSGYGDVHWNAVALGTYLYGCLGLIILQGLLARWFPRRVALGATILVGWGTFLYWYMVQQPTYAHAPSFFLVVLVVWQWQRVQESSGAWRHLVWGLTLGLAMAVRWQNGVFLLLPGIELLRRRDRALGRQVGEAAVLGLGVLVGVLPQLVAWRAIFGQWLLLQPPHGADFLRLNHPFLLETLFSSRHGLLSWTPVLWLGYLGFVPLGRRRPGLALPLVAPLLVMTYVNACSGDWWAGASFSNRRFDSCLPLLAFGIAASLEAARRFLAAHPVGVLASLGCGFIAANLALTVARRANNMDLDGRTFAAVAGRTAAVVSSVVGSPPTWPASWLFALEEQRPPSQYDKLVGRYLFYRQNNLGGRIELGDEGDGAYLGKGWGDRAAEGARFYRQLRGSAEVLVPLDEPLAMRLAVRGRAAHPTSVAVRVNGEHVASLELGPEWASPAVLVPARTLERNLNKVQLDTHGSRCEVDALVFTPARGEGR